LMKRQTCLTFMATLPLKK